MKIERTKNATRNIIFGVIQKIYTIIVPFVMRTAMIYFMGVEYLGLNSLFTSVLQVLNLAELGVGSAMVYSMYKPIAEDDTPTICALMRLYRTYYRIIGIVIAAAGLCATPFIPKLVKGSLPPELNIYVLYLMNLGITVLSYWLFAYKNCLLGAFQRGDVGSKISMILNTVQYVAQFCVLYFLRDYYVYLIVAMATGVCGNLVTAVVVTRMYPDYRPVGKLDNTTVKGINQRIRDLFTAKLGTVIVNSIDTLVISAFLGLSMLAVYQNYYYILSSVMGIVGIVFGACMAGIGNSIVVESKQKNYNDLKKFTFIISWIAGFCTTCLLCLYQPFIDIWVGKELKLDFNVVICLCIYYYIMEISQLLFIYKDASGMWHEDRFRPLVTASANLLMNLILVHFWGIYGVILSTVLSTACIGMPWLLNNLFTMLFEKKYMVDYLKRLFFYSGNSLVVCVIVYLICSFVKKDSLTTFVVRMGVCCILPNVFFLLLYNKKEEFKQSVELFDRMTKGKIKFLKKLYV